MAGGRHAGEERGCTCACRSEVGVQVCGISVQRSTATVQQQHRATNSSSTATTEQLYIIVTAIAPSVCCGPPMVLSDVHAAQVHVRGGAVVQYSNSTETATASALSVRCVLPVVGVGCSRSSSSRTKRSDSTVQYSILWHSLVLSLWCCQMFTELKFTYEEELHPEEFFVPYVWTLVVAHSGTPLEPRLHHHVPRAAQRRGTPHPTARQHTPLPVGTVSSISVCSLAYSRGNFSCHCDLGIRKKKNSEVIIFFPGAAAGRRG